MSVLVGSRSHNIIWHSEVMASKHSTSSEKLFACTNCHKRCKFEDLSPNQQLCKVCRKQFPSLNCFYCRLEYHPVKNTENPNKPACENCARDLKQYGRPSSCSMCTLQSAFGGKKCSRCLHSEKKYGPPSVCEHCNTRCAFPKPVDVKKKVDGKTLCLLCTIKYKRDQFKKRNGTCGRSAENSAAKRPRHHIFEHKALKMEPEPGPTLKKLKLEPATSDSSPLSMQSHSTLSTRDSQPLVDLLTSNHIIETDKLQNEISSLKKQLVHKDQALLEKDKQICQLRADASEKERDFRSKQQSLQRTHGEQLEQLKSEIRSLRTQLSKVSQKKTTSSDKQSSFASIASSLAATPSSN